MALLRKALMFAITSGLAKKAWDSYKQKNPVAAARAKNKLKEAGRELKDGGRDRPRSY